MKKYLLILSLFCSVQLFGQSADSATKVTQPIKPNDYRDSISTHIAEYGKGGLMSVSDSASMLSIMRQRRTVGMMVYLRNVKRFYYLKNNILNSSWTLFQSGGGGMSFDTTGLWLGKYDESVNSKLLQGKDTNWIKDLLQNGQSNIDRTLLNNSSGVNVLLGDTSKEYIGTYTIHRDTSERTGIFHVRVSNGKLLYNTGDYVETYSLGVIFNKFVLIGSNIDLNYTTTNTGFNSLFTYMPFARGTDTGKVKIINVVAPLEKTGISIITLSVDTGKHDKALATWSDNNLKVDKSSFPAYQGMSNNFIGPYNTFDFADNYDGGEIHMNQHNIGGYGIDGYYFHNGSTGYADLFGKNYYGKWAGDSIDYNTQISNKPSRLGGMLYWNGNTFIAYSSAPSLAGGFFYTYNITPSHSNLTRFDGKLQGYGLSTKDYEFPTSSGSNGQVLTRGTGTTTSWSTVSVITPTNISKVASKWLDSYIDGTFTQSQPLYSDISGVPTNLNQFTNGPGYITTYTETDPIYSAWNKSSGISITKSQISDLTLAQNISAPAHNWLKTYSSGSGAFTYSRPDYSDLSGTPTIPTDISQLTFNYGILNTGSITEIKIGMNSTESIGVLPQYGGATGVRINQNYFLPTSGATAYGQFLQYTDYAHGITSWSTYSLPSSSGAAGQILQSNGYNLVLENRGKVVTLGDEGYGQSTWDVALGHYATLDFTGITNNITLNITNPIRAGAGTLFVTQNLISSHQIIFPSGSIFKDNINTIPTVLGSHCEVAWSYDGTRFWFVISSVFQ